MKEFVKKEVIKWLDVGIIWFLSLILRLCEIHGVVFEGGKKRLKITRKIIPATVARISQESNVQRARSDHSDKDPLETPTQPPSSNPAPPLSSKDSVSSRLSSLESRISLVELTQHGLEELRLAWKSQQDVWKYMEAWDVAMQRHFREMPKGFTNSPTFPRMFSIPLLVSPPMTPILQRKQMSRAKSHLLAL